MDFSKLLNTVKDNLGLREEVVNEEDLLREKEQENYETNLIKTYNINLEKIKYSHQSINILNKQERENMNNLYENINPIQNIYNKNGEIVHIKELNVSTITMFFHLDCDVINLSMISKYICPLCNIIGCKQTNKLCKPFNENNIKQNKRGTKSKNYGKNDKFTCSINIPGASTAIPLKKLKQFDNQY